MNKNRGNLIFYVQKSAIGVTHDLIIKNFGNSPAKLISLKISPDLDWSKIGHSNVSEFNITKLSNIFLAPQQHIGTIFDFTDFDETELAVEVHYSTCGKEFTESYNVDLNYIHKVLSIEPDIKDELSTLKNINKSINSLSDKFRKPLAMSLLPTAKGFLNNMDLFVTQPPVNHSLTIKPLDYKNNGSYATVINLLSKDF